MQTSLPKRTPLYAFLFFVVMAVGCTANVRVDSISDAVGGPMSVTGRHDAYVQADQQLSEFERATYLAESARIVNGVKSAVAEGDDEISPGPLVVEVNGVVNRHNDYIALDTSLSDVAKQVFINEGVLLRRVFNEANKSTLLSGIGEESPIFPDAE